MLLLNAIRKAATDMTAIRDAIEHTHDYVGVTAAYTYGPEDHLGTRADSVVVLTVRDGRSALAGR